MCVEIHMLPIRAGDATLIIDRSGKRTQWPRPPGLPFPDPNYGKRSSLRRPDGAVGSG